MTANSHSSLDEKDSTQTSLRRTRVILFLNVLAGLLFFVVAYFSYTYLSQDDEISKAKTEAQQSKSSRVLQLDVLNGCGAKGVSAKFTSYLRAHEFDVVDIRNYRSSHLPLTLVVDRVGNLEAARRVASALGVGREQIVQQINPDYFVDVSVIIGEDYARLSPSH